MQKRIAALILVSLVPIFAINAPAADQFTPVVVSPLTAAAIPFTGTDGKIHIVYELVLTNANATPATLQKSRCWRRPILPTYWHLTKGKGCRRTCVLPTAHPWRMPRSSLAVRACCWWTSRSLAQQRFPARCVTGFTCSVATRRRERLRLRLR